MVLGRFADFCSRGRHNGQEPAGRWKQSHRTDSLALKWWRLDSFETAWVSVRTSRDEM